MPLLETSLNSIPLLGYTALDHVRVRRIALLNHNSEHHTEGV